MTLVLFKVIATYCLCIAVTSQHLTSQAQTSVAYVGHEVRKIGPRRQDDNIGKTTN